MNDLTLLMMQIMVLSFFLLLGVVIRAKVKFFQKLFIPAPIIGGTIGLVLGPLVLGSSAVIPFPDDWLKLYAQLPGVIITPVMAASVFGIHISRKLFTGSVRRQFGYTVTFAASQYLIGALVGVVSIALFASIYPSFGLELFAGFSGGHGTAGIYGQVLQDMNAEWWNIGQGLGTAAATFGVFFGIIFGMFAINYMARKGEIKNLLSPKDLPEGMRLGVYKDESKRKSIGCGVTSSDSLDPIGYTFALISIPSVIAILIAYYSKKLQIPVLQDLGAYTWAVLLAALLWGIIDKCGLGWILDINTRNRLAGTFVDFLIVSAIISMPINSVLKLLLPFSILMVAGCLGAGIMLFVGRWVFKGDYWFERSIMTFGQCTGVSATGVLLLRVVDPNFKTPALSAWGYSYVLTFPIAYGIVGICSRMAVNYGMWSIALPSLLVLIAGLIIAKITVKQK